MKKYIKLIYVILIGLIIFCLLAYSFDLAQEEAFFNPWHNSKAYEELKKDASFEEVIIEKENFKLHGWVKPLDKNQKKPLLICYLGNGQNSSNFLVKSKMPEYFKDYNLLIVDYPKYGLSTGKLIEKDLFEAVLSVYDYGKKLSYVDDSKIVVFGFSIGTGMATYVASQREVNGLVLLAPYDNALNLYNDNLNIFYGPIEKIRKYRFESDKYAEDVKVKPLIVASKSDEVINYNHSIDLGEKFEDVERFILINGEVSHNDIMNSITVYEAVQKYLQERL